MSQARYTTKQLARKANKREVKLFQNTFRMGTQSLLDKMYCVQAAIYSKNILIGVGTNSYTKTHPLQKRYGLNPFKIYLHAEVEAIVRGLRCSPSLEGTTVVVVRVLRSGGFGSSFPCDGCFQALKHYGIANIVYSDGTFILSHTI